MTCPKCNSSSISSLVNTNTKTKGFGTGNACCGYLLFGWPGVLCGLCNSGDSKSTTNISNICNDCGRRF